jgi:hypothetical protein
MLTTKNDYFPISLASFFFPIEVLYVLCKVRKGSSYVIAINFTIQSANAKFDLLLKTDGVVRIPEQFFWLTINLQNKKEYRHCKIYTNMNTEWYYIKKQCNVVVRSEKYLPKLINLKYKRNSDKRDRKSKIKISF